MFAVGMYGVDAIEADDASRMVVVDALGERRRIPYERVAFMVPEAAKPAEAPLESVYPGLSAEGLTQMRQSQFNASANAQALSQIQRAALGLKDPNYQHPKAKGKR